MNHAVGPDGKIPFQTTHRISFAIKQVNGINALDRQRLNIPRESQG